LDEIVASNEDAETKLGMLTKKRKIDLRANLDIAWDALSKALNVNHGESRILQGFLNELGITESRHLDYCDDSHLTTIARHLKEIPRRVFLEAMNKRYCEPRF
jgi:hypothetical protein